MNLKKVKTSNGTYVVVLLKVDARDDQGRPSRVTVGYDDTTFQVEEGMEFITALVKPETVKKKVLQ